MNMCRPKSWLQPSHRQERNQRVIAVTSSSGADNSTTSDRLPQPYREQISFAVYFVMSFAALMAYSLAITRDDPYIYDYMSIVRDGRFTVLPFDGVIFWNYPQLEHVVFLLSVIAAGILAAIITRFVSYFCDNALLGLAFGVPVAIVYLSSHTMMTYNHILLMRTLMLLLTWGCTELWLRQVGLPLRSAVWSIVGAAVCAALVAITYQVTIVLPAALILLIFMHQYGRETLANLIRKYALFLVVTVLAFVIMNLLMRSSLYAYIMNTGLRSRANVTFDVTQLVDITAYWDAFKYRLGAFNHPVFERIAILAALYLAVLYFLIYPAWDWPRRRLYLIVGGALTLALFVNPILAADYLNRRADDEINTLIIILMIGYCGVLVSARTSGAIPFLYNARNHAIFALFTLIGAALCWAALGSAIKPVGPDVLVVLMVLFFVIAGHAILQRRALAMRHVIIVAVSCAAVVGMQHSWNRMRTLTAINDLDRFFMSRIFEEIEAKKLETGKPYRRIKLGHVPEGTHSYYSVLRSYSGAALLSDYFSAVGYSVETDYDKTCDAQPPSGKVVTIVPLDDLTVLVCLNDRK